MKTLAYYNGKIDSIENLSVPFSDRVCYFGDGVYDATYAHNYNIFTLDEHLNRFFLSARKVTINIPITQEELKLLLINLVKKMDFGELFVYWQVTRGTQTREHSFDKDIPGNLWIMIKKGELQPLDNNISVRTEKDLRHHRCDIKTLNLLPNVLSASKAKEENCYETIYLRAGIVTECSHSNVSIIKDGILYTHPTDNLILAGVARAHLLKACMALGIEYAECEFGYKELIEADEIIITSSGSLCLTVESLDGHLVGGKDVNLTKKLKRYLLTEFLEETENNAR